MKDAYGRSLECPRCGSMFLFKTAFNRYFCKTCKLSGKEEEFRAVPSVDWETMAKNMRKAEEWNPSRR